MVSGIAIKGFSLESGEFRVGLGSISMAACAKCSTSDPSADSQVCLISSICVMREFFVDSLNFLSLIELQEFTPLCQKRSFGRLSRGNIVGDLLSTDV